MISKRTVTIAAMSVLAGVGAFFATRAIAAKEDAVCVGGGSRQRPCQALVSWMQLSAEQAQAITADNAAFEKDCCRLDAELEKQRQTLANLLEDPSTPKKDVLRQVERVISTHNALERTVAKYLLSVRDHLTVAQQERLMGLCAQSVRERPCSSLRGCSGGRCGR